MIDVKEDNNIIDEVSCIF